MKQNIVKP